MSHQRPIKAASLVNNICASLSTNPSGRHLTYNTEKQQWGKVEKLGDGNLISMITQEK
jgi:hypothetical protein